MKKLLTIIASVVSLFSYGQTTPTLRQVTSAGTAITKLPSLLTATVSSTDTIIVFQSPTWKKTTVSAITNTVTGTPSWSLTGNAGTVDGTNFIGTTDAQDVVFKRNSSEIMRLSNGGLTFGNAMDFFMDATAATQTVFRLGTPTTTAYNVLSFHNTGIETLSRIIGGLYQTTSKVSPGSLLITSTYSVFPGAQYASDYSANFTARSLIDKGYADTTYTVAGTNFIGTTDSVDFIIKSNNKSRLAVSANGVKVGIGTTSPETELDIRGTHSTGRMVQIKNNPVNSKASLMTFNADTGNVIFSIGSSNTAVPCLFCGVDDITSAHIFRFTDGVTYLANTKTYNYLDLIESQAHVSFGPRLTQPFQIYNEITNKVILTASSVGNIFIGDSYTDALAKLHLEAGTTSVAPLKFTSGALLSTRVPGSHEFLMDDEYITITTDSARHKIGRVLIGSDTLDFANQAAIGCNDLTVTVTGAVDGDDVSVSPPNGSVPSASSFFIAWVSSANTVTVRYCALVSGDPASGIFKVTVIKN